MPTNVSLVKTLRSANYFRMSSMPRRIQSISSNLPERVTMLHAMRNWLAWSFDEGHGRRRLPASRNIADSKVVRVAWRFDEGQRKGEKSTTIFFTKKYDGVSGLFCRPR